MRLLLSALSILLLTTGCASVRLQTLGPGEAPTVVGPAVRTNRTPLDPAMACYNRKLAAALAGRKLQIAVGEVKDYTGKMSDTEGTAITQGGSLMLFSGLCKLKDAVAIHDRFDMRVTDAELKYIGLRQLGDGRSHDVGGKQVPWMPYFGGTIKKSDYAILGGITELNYNIQSGGAEVRVNQVGPAARVYTMSVAADLRLIKTQTLEVVSAVSLQKQFTGFEVGFELFRFYDLFADNDLLDINIGNKSQEPLQLGIRAIIEESILHLLADATGVDYADCLPQSWRYPEAPEGDKVSSEASTSAAAAMEAPTRKEPNDSQSVESRIREEIMGVAPNRRSQLLQLLLWIIDNEKDSPLNIVHPVKDDRGPVSSEKIDAEVINPEKPDAGAINLQTDDAGAKPK
jgi:curli production assembly/transport component CsgG/holdfast attachment protein HfaB